MKCHVIVNRSWEQTTRIGCLFDLRKPCDFNPGFNVFDKELSDLKDAYDFDFDASTSIRTDTIDTLDPTTNTASLLNFTATRGVSREVNILDYDFNTTLAPTVVTIVTNEKQIKMNVIHVK